jgi:hypothetical protein
MTCDRVRPQLAGYLDGTLAESSAVPRSLAAQHLSECVDCRAELESYRQLQQLLNRAEPVAPPEDLAVRIRIAAAKARAEQPAGSKLRKFRDHIHVVLENILQPLALPATGGFVAAIFVFAIVMPFYARVAPLTPGPDALPATFFQQARLETLAGFSVSALDEGKSEILLVQATVGADGSVVNYEILSGPRTPEVRRQLDQILMFSRFRPSTSFGRPISGGTVVMSFSAVNVHG